jgi:hypothetical protein
MKGMAGRLAKVEKIQTGTNDGSLPDATSPCDAPTVAFRHGV